MGSDQRSMCSRIPSPPPPPPSCSLTPKTARSLIPDALCTQGRERSGTMTRYKAHGRKKGPREALLHSKGPPASLP